MITKKQAKFTMHAHKSTSLFIVPSLVVSLAASLASCSTPATLDAPDVVKNTESTIQYIEESTWTVLGCKVEATVDNTHMSTDGAFSHNTLRYAVKLPRPSATYLNASLYGIGGVSLNVTGRRNNWSLELPNTPYAQAQMIEGKTYLLLSYTPEATTSTPVPLEKIVVFPLKSLPAALAEREAACN